MAISWGAWQNHVRLGIDVIMSPASVGSGTMSVALTIRMYAQTDGSSSVYGNWPVTFSGAWTGSGTVAINLGPGQSALIWTTNTSRATSTSSQVLSYNATVSHALGSSSIARSFTIPARPAAPPAAPGTPIVVRNSDTSLTVSWSRTSTYTAVVVQRSTGDNKWVQVGRPTGNAYTFTDTTTTANQRYFYRVAGVNAGGQSGWSGNSASTYTTPNPPTAVSAVRDGANIVVTGTPGNAWATKYDVMDGASVIATDVALPYTHVNPSTSAAHQYKLRARIGTLPGGWSAPSNVVQLTAPPAAPTGLAPNGVNIADDTAAVFAWTHNPTDSSKQSAAELRYRKTGTSTWTTLTATTASQITGPVLAADPWEWQARTKGAHADWSPWSAVATLTSITRPGVAIVTPAETWDRPTLPVEWTWQQLRGIPQSAWQVELVTDDTGELVESLSGQNGAVSAMFAHRVDDGETYRVRVRGAAGALWSEWAEQRVEIVFVPPAIPIVDAVWDEETGTASISITAEPEVGKPDAVSVTVERRVGDEPWEPIVVGQVLDPAEPGIPAALSLIDPLCLSYGPTQYRVTAYSDIGAAAVAEVTVLADSWAVWLNAGGQLEQAARLPFDPTVGDGYGRERTTHRFSGRFRPVAYASEQLSRTVRVGGTLHDGDDEVATRDQLRLVAIDPAPVHMLRNPTGLRMFGSLSDVALEREFDGEWSFEFSIEETDR